MRKYTFFLLTFFLLITCRSQPDVVTEHEVNAIEPELEVVSIYILQADIVVTEFETVLKVTNPNDFAVDLTDITYRLYGNGAFWTNGRGVDLLHIPALSSAETKFTFSMNFINMNRRLLDDVIARRRVQYRFIGEAQVKPVNSRIEAFRMSYESSGFSEVKPKAD
jgi:LEA14-like dessication related protein